MKMCNIRQSQKKGTFRSLLFLPLSRHIAGPTVTEVPVLIIDVFEVWEGEFLLEKSGEFFLNGLGPMTYKDDELVDVPGYSTA